MARNKHITGPTETVEEYLARGGNVTVYDAGKQKGKT